MAAARCSVIILGVTVPVRAVEGVMMSACGYRYVIALDGYFVEEYEVWESISDVVFPMKHAMLLGTVGTIYADRIPRLPRQVRDARRIFPEAAAEMHFMWDESDDHMICLHRCSSMPPSMYIRYGVNIPDPRAWFQTRELLDPVVVNGAEHNINAVSDSEPDQECLD